MTKSPKEDPIEQQERLRQRRVADLDRRRAAKANAKSLTSDIRSVYGVGGLSMFGGRSTAVRRPAVFTTPKTTFTQTDRK